MSRRGKGEACTYCRRTLEGIGSTGRLAATRDHVEPSSRGGFDTVWCCRACNSLKGSMSLADWQAFMAEHPKWWLAVAEQDMRAARAEFMRRKHMGMAITPVTGHMEVGMLITGPGPLEGGKIIHDGMPLRLSGESNRMRHKVTSHSGSTVTFDTHCRPSRGYARYIRRKKASR